MYEAEANGQSGPEKEAAPAPTGSKIIDRARFFRRYGLAHRGGYFAPERVDTPYIPLSQSAGLQYPDGSIVVFVQRRPGIATVTRFVPIRVVTS